MVLDPLKFFDCSSVIGKRGVIHPGSFYQTDELLRKMAYYGIDKSLVYHSLALGYTPVAGNNELLDEIKNIPQLEGVWVVLPHHTGDFPHPLELRKELKSNNIRAVRMFPGNYEFNFSLSQWCCGDLFSMLEECRIPVIIDCNQLSWDNLHDILSRHPDMPIILTKLHYSAGRAIYPLLYKFENLFLEVIGLKIYEGIEDICRKFGANRIIFGSSAPLYSGSSAVGMVTYADISQKEKSMIAHGNLENLLGGVRL
jgi:predicted TIM-barrel fold metal-dependent hydrolase